MLTHQYQPDVDGSSVCAVIHGIGFARQSTKAAGMHEAIISATSSPAKQSPELGRWIECRASTFLVLSSTKCFSPV